LNKKGDENVMSLEEFSNRNYGHVKNAYFHTRNVASIIVL